MLDSKGRLSFKRISPFRILESPLIIREGDLNARQKPLPISGKGKGVISSLNDKPNPLSAIISGANDKEASSSGGSFAKILKKDIDPINSSKMDNSNIMGTYALTPTKDTESPQDADLLGAHKLEFELKNFGSQDNVTESVIKFPSTTLEDFESNDSPGSKHVLFKELQALGLVKELPRRKIAELKVKNDLKGEKGKGKGEERAMVDEVDEDDTIDSTKHLMTLERKSLEKIRYYAITRRVRKDIARDYEGGSVKSGDRWRRLTTASDEQRRRATGKAVEVREWKETNDGQRVRVREIGLLPEEVPSVLTLMTSGRRPTTASGSFNVRPGPAPSRNYSQLDVGLSTPAFGDSDQDAKMRFKRDHVHADCNFPSTPGSKNYSIEDVVPKTYGSLAAKCGDSEIYENNHVKEPVKVLEEKDLVIGQSLAAHVKEPSENMNKDLGTSTIDFGDMKGTDVVESQNNLDLQTAVGTVNGMDPNSWEIFSTKNKFYELNAIVEEGEIVDVEMSPGNYVIKEAKCCVDKMNLDGGLKDELNIVDGNSSTF
ncbi:hypothetical protein MA16_Dca002208 [Dendrobium catenatum]|uniref:Uncharacterized protein n=1 Tax=Dendrobium catenatum TaxID=906689 RepID=A0A2I0VZV7_9ASPA|nr:hypothetical protein MA16_Dca002208 [Dendrobium catenatum]